MAPTVDELLGYCAIATPPRTSRVRVGRPEAADDVDPPDRPLIGRTFVLSRVVALDPVAAVGALERWSRSRPALIGSRAYFHRVGPLNVADAPAADGWVSRLSAHVGHAHWPRLRVEIEVAPWSGASSELRLRPVRAPTYPSRYLRRAHAILDRLVVDLMALAARDRYSARDVVHQPQGGSACSS